MQILPVPGLEVRADSTFKICLKVHENNKEHLHRFKLNSSTRAETFTEIYVCWICNYRCNGNFQSYLVIELSNKLQMSIRIFKKHNAIPLLSHEQAERQI